MYGNKKGKDEKKTKKLLDQIVTFIICTCIK